MADIIQNSGNITGFIARHEYIDLGLSVRWATCNVGATTPSAGGVFCHWGETYEDIEYEPFETHHAYTLGIKMGEISGLIKYDIAAAEWGNPWRMPRRDEVEELINNCTFEKVSQGETEGYIVTGPNGNTIFLPLSSVCYPKKEDKDLRPEPVCYWSGTPDELSNLNAIALKFFDDSVGWSVIARNRVGFVRPVVGEFMSDKQRYKDAVEAEGMSKADIAFDAFMKIIFTAIGVMCCGGAISLLFSWDYISFVGIIVFIGLFGFGLWMLIKTWKR